MNEREYIERVRDICAADGATRVLLFGSRARGTNSPRSDFDFAVYGVDDTRQIVEQVDSLPTLYSADIVNMQRCRNRNLREEVAEHGILV